MAVFFNTFIYLIILHVNNTFNCPHTTFIFESDLTSRLNLYNLCAQVYFQVEITSMYVALQRGLMAKVTHKSSDKASCLFTVKKVKPRFLTDLIQSNLVLSTEFNS